MKRSLKIAAGLGAFALLLLAARQLPLLAAIAWVKGLGWPGMALYAGIYIAAVLALVPGSLLTLAAGTLYGPLWGLVLVSGSSTVAATVAFLLGRSVARDWIKRKMTAYPRFERIEAAVSERGAVFVGLLRLTPLFPFAVGNYALGLTSIRLRDYIVASWLGMLPGTFLFVYLGSLVDDVARVAAGEAPDGGPLRYALLGLGLAATLAVTVLLGRIAKTALDEPALASSEE